MGNELSEDTLAVSADCRLPGFNGRSGLYRFILTLILFLGLLVIAAPVSAEVWTLNTTDSIEANISLASPGDTLILNPGTYQQYNITVSKNVTIMSNISAGGSAGNTIIDAMNSGRIFYDNSTAGYTLTIEGLTLTNGSLSDEEGGAICTTNGSVEISSSVITDCSALTLGNGGAIYSSSGNVIATSCTFNDCFSNTGGAICAAVVNTTSCSFTRCGSSVCLGGAISSDDVTAISCSFTGCFAWSGGGIFSDAVTVRSCNFTDCAAYTSTGIGGGISSDDVVAESCSFINCSSKGDGGGIYSNTTSVVFCDFTDCKAVYDGGGISSLDATVTSCSFTSCYGTGGYSYGGGICSNYDAGGTFLISSSSFTGCRASAGGGLYSELSTVTVISCTFINCRGIDSGGAILSMDNNYLTISSCTFTGCSALNYAGAILSDTDYTTYATITSSDFTNCSAENMYGGVIYANYSISAIHYCRIYDCNGGTAVVMEDGTMDAENNWWGTNSDPSGYTKALSGGPVDVSPWLVLGTAPSPSSITAGDSSIVSADLTRNSADEDTSPGGYVPDGIPVTFTLAGGPGSLSSLSGATVSGVSATTYSSSSPGTATIAATVDNQIANCTVQVNSGGGSSSGGSGGSNTDTGIGFAEDLKAGENVSLEMNKGAVYRVDLTAKTDIEKLMITVRKDSSVPSSVGEPDWDVYEYEEVTLYYADESDLSDLMFYFKVKKSWPASNGYGYGDVLMLRFNEETDEWEELTTTFTGEDGTYYYYSAETPSFSWFAIAVSEDATIIPEGTETEVATQAATSVNTPSSSVATAVSTTSPGNSSIAEGEKSLTSLAIPALAVILVIIAVIGLVSRKKKDEYPDWWDHGRR
ncbi:polymorphic outer membrane protein [Methanolacinia petrolearia DSM 11571]|uniref:Polymorphic outer membrane protein n=1 Tax=Methanolacinia petrolearia (strain DSM 11571 / OCM 486 / SEBR 4847) TaxID=679926 RepID=E1REN4_METP4|nr:polymorphic outer membrane protein [Methanolacinia petrolearia DSM 11571]